MIDRTKFLMNFEIKMHVMVSKNSNFVDNWFNSFNHFVLFTWGNRKCIEELGHEKVTHNDTL